MKRLTNKEMLLAVFVTATMMACSVLILTYIAAPPTEKPQFQIGIMIILEIFLLTGIFAIGATAWNKWA
jgi:hypothetical protein